MTLPVDVYREMLKKDVAGPHVASREEVLSCLESYWTKAGEEHEESQWPAEQRASRRLWAGLGFLAFGDLDHLEETLKIMQAYPRAVASKTTRFYMSALQKLLPLPEGLSPAETPADALRWLNSVRQKLAWNEEVGQFENAVTVVAAPSVTSLPTDTSAEDYSSGRHRFIVMDYNVWGNVKIMEEIVNRCRSERLKILVPDVAFYQLGRSAGSHDHCRAVLRHFAKERDLFWTAQGIGEMMRTEVHLGQPTTNPVDERLSKHFVQVLEEIESGGCEKTDAFLTRLFEVAQQETSRREIPDMNLHLISDLRRQWQQTLPATDLDSIRSQDEAVFIRIMSDWETAAIVFQATKRDGCTDQAAVRLTLEPSAYGHLVYGMAALSLDSFSADEIAGGTQDWTDLSELDYLCIALFCKDLTTLNERLSRIYSRLIKALQIRDELVKALSQSKRKTSGSANSRFNGPAVTNLSKKMRKPHINVPAGHGN